MMDPHSIAKVHTRERCGGERTPLRLRWLSTTLVLSTEGVLIGQHDVGISHIALEPQRLCV